MRPTVGGIKQRCVRPSVRPSVCPIIPQLETGTFYCRDYHHAGRPTKRSSAWPYSRRPRPFGGHRGDSLLGLSDGTVQGWVAVRSGVQMSGGGANAVNSVPHRVLRRYIYPDSTRGATEGKLNFPFAMRANFEQRMDDDRVYSVYTHTRKWSTRNRHCSPTYAIYKHARCRAVRI